MTKKQKRDLLMWMLDLKVRTINNLTSIARQGPYKEIIRQERQEMFEMKQELRRLRQGR